MFGTSLLFLIMKHMCSHREFQEILERNVLKWQLEIRGVDLKMDSSQRVVRDSFGRLLSLFPVVKPCKAEVRTDGVLVSRSGKEVKA